MGLGSVGMGPVGMGPRRGWAAAGIVKVSGCAAAAWIVKLTASLVQEDRETLVRVFSHFDGFAAANQRCLWKGPAAPSRASLLVASSSSSPSHPGL